jgi:two-component system sensor histidine kinase/response regulator
MHQSHSSTAFTARRWSSAATIEHFGGDESLVRELIGLFLNSCPRHLETLRTRSRENDLTALGRAAHALKGSLSNFTREAPTTTASELERLCRLGRRDAAAATIERLEVEVSQLVSEMKAFQKGLV